MLQWRPIVADCLVPQHSLVPDLEKKASVKAVEFAKKRGKKKEERLREGLDYRENQSRNSCNFSANTN
jgi:hypothetical protein